MRTVTRRWYLRPTAAAGIFDHQTKACVRTPPGVRTDIRLMVHSSIDSVTSTDVTQGAPSQNERV
jgi:hypothetical protein